MTMLATPGLCLPAAPVGPAFHRQPPSRPHHRSGEIRQSYTVSQPQGTLSIPVQMFSDADGNIELGGVKSRSKCKILLRLVLENTGNSPPFFSHTY